MWFKTYPWYTSLAYIFGISRLSALCIVNWIWPFLYEPLKQNIAWPSPGRWGDLKGTWSKLPGAVGAFNSTFHRIDIPSMGPQHLYLYYSRHRRYHCLHTQIVIDAILNIRHVESGVLFHDKWCTNISNDDSIWVPKSFEFSRELFSS
jgi:hypothetical protein